MSMAEQDVNAKKKAIRLIIERQDDPNSPPYSETFDIPWRAGMNVIAALMEIQRNPVNAQGEKVRPVAWESNCLEEVCGACTMVINGKPRQSCSALLDQLAQPIYIKPMRTFPVMRDLIVNRSRMFDALKRIKAWVPIDGTYDLGPGPRMPEVDREWAYELAKCFTCGSCVEACPNVNERTSFIGAFALSQARLFNTHPTGAMHKKDRFEALMGEGGIHECGNSQNCVQVCPKGIPLTTSIAAMNRAIDGYAFSGWLGK